MGEARSKDKAADRKARTVPAMYRRKLVNINRQYYNTVPGEVGPCQERLESLGELLQLVVGFWGEISTDLDQVIRAVAEARVLYLARESGQPITDQWLSQVLGAHRRSLSTAFVRAQMAWLNSKMGTWGWGPGRRRPGGGGHGAGGEDAEGGGGTLRRTCAGEGEMVREALALGDRSPD